MRRTGLIAAAAALGLALLWASPAAAKVDVRRIVIEGPGLERPITLRDEDAWTFLLDSVAPPGSREVTAEPAGNLGPAHTVTVYQGGVTTESGDRGPVPEETLTLYPFAEDGAWFTFRPGGWLSSMLRGDAPSSHVWAVVTDAQVEMLRERGLTKPEASTDAPPEAPAPEAPAEDASIDTVTSGAESSGPGPFLAIGGVVLLGAAVAGRRALRRRPSPASNG